MKTAKLMGVCLCCVLLPVACSKTASSATGGDLPTQSESTSSQPAMDASLKLFGVQLKGADRKTFRVALLNDGLKLLRAGDWRSEEHTSELQSLMRISYAVFCLKKKNTQTKQKR